MGCLGHVTRSAVVRGLGTQVSGWPFKASGKKLVNRVLLSPIRENIKYPRGLPRFWGPGRVGVLTEERRVGLR